VGIYDDIQNDLGEALDSDLSDVYVDFNVVEMSGDPVYDVDTRSYTTPENSKPCKGIDLLEMQGELFDKPGIANTIEILVLDKDKPFIFRIGQRVEINSRNYRISGIINDPAGATWTISGLIWGK